MEFNINPVRSIHLRTNESTAPNGEVYVHGELALIDTLTDKAYVSSLGVAMRRDEMSATAKKQRQALFDAARKGTAEYDREWLEQSCAAVASTPADAQRLADDVSAELATV